MGKGLVLGRGEEVNSRRKTRGSSLSSPGLVCLCGRAGGRRGSRMTRGCGAVERFPAAYGEGDGPLMVMALQQRPTCPPTTSPLQPSTGSRSLGGRQDCSSPLLCGKENRVAGEAGGVGGALWRSLWCSTKVNERSCMYELLETNSRLLLFSLKRLC